MEDRIVLKLHHYFIEITTRDCEGQHEGHVEIHPDGNELIICPKIKYMPTSRQFVGYLPEIIPVKFEDKKLWMEGIDNMFLLLEELNLRVDELIPKDYKFW